MDLISTFFMAFEPIAKVFITCGFGAYLGHPNVNILTKDARKLLNRLVVVAFTPAFVFTNLAKYVSDETILRWWYMPFNVILCFACGAALGLLVTKYTAVPAHLRNLTIACCAAGNTGNVPLVLIPSICEEEGNPFGDSNICSQNAVAYVSYGMWMGIALTWTFAYKLLEPPGFHTHLSPPSSPVMTSSVRSPQSNDFGDFQTAINHPNMEEEHEKTSFSSKTVDDYTLPTLSVSSNQRDQVPANLAEQQIGGNPPDMLQDPKAYFVFIFDKYDLRTMCNPPTCAAILGLLVGAIPPLKSVCEGPFHVFMDSTSIIGQAMLPTMNMVLGASLVQGTGSSELEMPSIIGVIFVRLVALPVVGIISVKIVNDMGMLPVDPIFRLVLLLQFTMPTAINIGTMAQLFCVGEKESALVLLYAYLSATFLITFWIIIYLRYVI